MLKAQRYFFKEGSCPDGFVLCQKTNKCIPESAQKSQGKGKGKGFGQGKGPVGVPKNEDITMDKIDKLVDEVFDGGFAQFGKSRSVEKQVDKILDLVVSEVELGKGAISTSRPYDHPVKTKVSNGDSEVAVDECGGPMIAQQEDDFEDSEFDAGPERPDNPKKSSNDINQVPNQNPGELLKSVYDELSESQIWDMVVEIRINENYKKYFKAMLKKHGYSSPADIPADKKKDFFNAVDKGWKAVKEQIKRGGYGIIRRPDADRPRGGFGSIRGTQTTGGFGSIRGRDRNEEEDVSDEEVSDEEIFDEMTEGKGQLGLAVGAVAAGMATQAAHNLVKINQICKSRFPNDPEKIKLCKKKLRSGTRAQLKTAKKDYKAKGKVSEQNLDEGFFATAAIKKDAGKIMMAKLKGCMLSTSDSSDSKSLRDLKCSQIASQAAIASLKSGLGKCKDDKCKASIVQAIKNHQIGMKKRIINIKNMQQKK